jgi:hypothetical protein
VNRDDTLTISAIAITAMCVATFAHEAAGHGSACLLQGDRITQLTSVYFQCSIKTGVAAAGPLGNFVAGLLGWIGLKALPERAARGRLFALLTLAFSLFWAAGYAIYSAVLNDGDYAFAARDLLGSPPWWRIAAIMVGIALYVLCNRLVVQRTSVLRIAWVAATTAAAAAALLYTPDRIGSVEQALLEIGAASLPLLGNRAPDDTPAIMRSPVWIAVALVVFAGFAATLGRGIP